jgi:hypothetical protein
MSRKCTKHEMQLLMWRSDVFHGQWGPGPIPKMTHFTYWNRIWEVKVSKYTFMGWDLYAWRLQRQGRSSSHL